MTALERAIIGLLLGALLAWAWRVWQTYRAMIRVLERVNARRSEAARRAEVDQIIAHLTRKWAGRP